MKPKRTNYLWIRMGCACLFLFSAYMIFSYYAESLAQEALFDELEEMASVAASPPATMPKREKDSEKAESTSAILPEYEVLYEKNHDLFGWVQIEGTKLNYPVMVTPDAPEYYLHRDFDRQESSSGVPFLDEDCLVGEGNYLVYGHNMNAGTMFAPLISYVK